MQKRGMWCPRSVRLDRCASTRRATRVGLNCRDRRRIGAHGPAELRGRHGGTCFDCGRRQGVARPSMVGHITLATGAPQRRKCSRGEVRSHRLVAFGRVVQEAILQNSCFQRLINHPSDQGSLAGAGVEHDENRLEWTVWPTSPRRCRAILPSAPGRQACSCRSPGGRARPRLLSRRTNPCRAHRRCSACA
jgi:hypothetical protein